MNLLTNPISRIFVASLHLACAAVVAVTIGGFYMLVLQPLERKQADHLGQTEHFDGLLLRTGTAGREYRRLRDQLSGMKQTVAELHGQLGAPRQETQFVEDLSSMAADVDLDILDHQVGLPRKLATHSQTEVEFRCHGSYASICRFLEQAEQFTKTTKLSKFELAASGTAHEYPIQLTFVLYSEGKSNDTREKRGVL